jgi:hypothetical protein
MRWKRFSSSYPLSLGDRNVRQATSEPIHAWGESLAPEADIRNDHPECIILPTENDQDEFGQCNQTTSDT